MYEELLQYTLHIILTKGLLKLDYQRRGKGSIMTLMARVFFTGWNNFKGIQAWMSTKCVLIICKNGKIHEEAFIIVQSTYRAK